MSYSAEKIIDVRDIAPKDKPAVFVIGAMAHGSVSTNMRDVVQKVFKKYQLVC